MKKFAVIVGGGKGVRLGSEIPKQFLMLGNRPLLFHTIEKFSGLVDQTVLVLPKTHFDYWTELCTLHKPGFHISLVEGGTTRSKSVLNGINALEGEGLVAIHDAVRPLTSQQLIINLFSSAARFGNAIPFIPMRESIRVTKGSSTRSVDRKNYLVVQTPQCFDLGQLKEAYRKTGEMEFTDDASLFEHFGGKINPVQGESTNIKITYNEDLFIAEALINAIKP